MALARARRAQIVELERMLAPAGASPGSGVCTSTASPEPIDRAARLQHLAELYLELSILREDEPTDPDPGVARPAAGDEDLEAAATTCRKLLVAHPRYVRAAQVRLLLARIELRRGRTGDALEVAGEVCRGHPAGDACCQARLIAGDACTQRGDHALAARHYRRVTREPSCAASDRELVLHGGYRLGWSLMRQGQIVAGGRVLQELLSTELPPLFRQRLLRDLVLAWSTGQPPAGAATLLRRHAGAQLGWQLVRSLAAQLLEQGQLEPLLVLTDEARQLSPSLPDAIELGRLRLAALARHGDPGRLRSEIAWLAKTRPALRQALVEPAASALLQLAAHLLEPEPGASTAALETARALLRQLVHEFADTATASHAHRRLGDLARRDDDHRAAARHYRRALARAAEPARAEISYHRIYCLQRLFDRPRPPDRRGPATGRSFVAAARQFAQRYPAHAETPAVLLAAADVLFRLGQHRSALETARSYLQQHGSRAGAAQRSAALQLALGAAEQLADHATAWSLAADELQRCQAAPPLPVPRQLPRASMHDEPGLQLVAAPAAAPPVAGGAGLRCPDDALGSLRQRAARAALQQASGLIRSNALDRAGMWIARALQADAASPQRHRALWLAAALAARRGAVEDADRHYQQLVRQSRDRAERRRALVARAELAEAVARFGHAAALYDEAAELAPALAQRLSLLERAVTACGLERPLARGGRKIGGAVGAGIARHPGCHGLVSRLRGAVGSLSQRAQRQWLQRTGRALALVDRDRARRFLVRAAAELPPRQGRLAAALLIDAADLAQHPGRIGLYQRALLLAGPLRRRGRPSTIAARARVAHAAEQRRLLTAGAARRPRQLQRLVDELAQVVLVGDPRWSAAATLHLAWAYGEMASDVERTARTTAGAIAGEEADEPRARALVARDRARGVVRQAAVLRARQRALMRQLARLARQDSGLNRYTMEAVGAPPEPLLVDRSFSTRPAGGARGSATSVPGPTVRAAAELLGHGRVEAALLSSSRALGVGVPDQHAALRCARAVAEATAGRPERAWAELLAALAVAPAASCVRHNLESLARQRGDAQLARTARAQRSPGPGPISAASSAGRPVREGRPVEPRVAACQRGAR